MSQTSKWIDKLEDDVKSDAYYIKPRDLALMSLAISMKKIADSLQEIKNKIV